MENSATDLSDHVLVLGTSELTPVIIEELRPHADCLVVSADGAADIDLDEDVMVREGDPGSRETLERAGIDDASAVIAAAESDAQDAMAILTAKKTAPSIRIAAAASSDENVTKLKRAGADVVISPNTLGGRLMVESALSERSADELLGEIVRTS